jgi:hypothetical protein
MGLPDAVGLRDDPGAANEPADSGRIGLPDEDGGRAPAQEHNNDDGADRTPDNDVHDIGQSADGDGDDVYLPDDRTNAAGTDDHDSDDDGDDSGGLSRPEDADGGGISLPDHRHDDDGGGAISLPDHHHHDDGAISLPDHRHDDDGGGASSPPNHDGDGSEQSSFDDDAAQAARRTTTAPSRPPAAGACDPDRARISCANTPAPGRHAARRLEEPGFRYRFAWRLLR